MATTTRRAVYCDGVWDLFHAGHLEFLQNVRSAAARDLGVANAEIHLVCGVITDEDTASYKRLPVVPHAQRVDMIRQCRLVDTVVAHPPLVLTDAFLDAHGVELVFHADDSLQEDFFAAAIARGIMRYVGYSLRASTSRILGEVQRRSRDETLESNHICKPLR